MGTSASSNGPGGGVPLVPPWVPDPGSDDSGSPESGEGEPESPESDGGPEGSGPSADESGDPEGKDASPPPRLAPAGRFGNARRALGDFASGGSSSRMKQGLGRYVARGLGGSGRAARRMGGASVRSGALYGALRSLAGESSTETSNALDSSKLVGRSPKEIIDAVVQLVSPSDGTQDAESSQNAISAAFSDLLERQPDVDLTALNTEQIDWLVERHLVYEIHNRIQLDIGQSVLKNAPSAAIAVRRLREIREYVQETVAAAFRARRGTNQLTTKQATMLANQVIGDTFEVFEDYV